MTTLTQEQLNKAIELGRSQGYEDRDIAASLIKNGYDIPNVDTKQFIADYKQAVQERGNVGTGFTPTKEYTGEENVVELAGKTLVNTPKSAFELTKNVATAVTKPVQTAKALGTAVKGAGAFVGEKLLENTGFGNRLLEKANQYRSEQGLPLLQTDEQGNLQAEDTQALETAKQLGGFFAERYGGVENFKESVVEDPVGVLADVAAVLSGAGLATKSLGEASKISKISEVGQTLQKAGQVVEPVTALQKAGSKVKSIVPKLKGSAKEIAKDVNPFDRAELTRSGISKALDVSPSDIAKIESNTGNKIDEFILQNTQSNTPLNIAEELGVVKNTSMDEVRRLISDVDKKYSGEDVLRTKQALNNLDNLYKDVAGLEEKAAEIAKLNRKRSYDLSDIQRVKELLDEADQIYSKSGETKAGVTSKGLANVRKDLKSFIESEVQKNLGDDSGNIIKELNNKTQTAKSLEDLIIKRSTRQLTRQGITVFELLLGIGGFSQFGLGGAAGVLLTKRFVESPTFRIALARTLQNSPKAKLTQIAKEAASGKISEATLNELRNIADKAKENAQFIESGANTLDVLTEEES